MLHGAYLILNHGWRALRARFAVPVTRLETLCGGAITFFCVVAGWVFFRATNLGGAGRMLKGMAGLDGGDGSDVWSPLGGAIHRAVQRQASQRFTDRA